MTGTAKFRMKYRSKTMKQSIGSTVGLMVSQLATVPLQAGKVKYQLLQMRALSD